MRLAFLIPPILLLAACGQEKKPTDETEISINADGDGGKIQVSSGKDGGKLKVNGDGVNIDLDIPDLGEMDLGSDFDIDGVDLYPGSVIKTMNVDAVRKAGNKVSTVKAGFESPTDAKTLTDWFEAEMKKEKSYK